MLKTEVYSTDGKELIGTIYNNGDALMSYDAEGEQSDVVSGKASSFIHNYEGTHPETKHLSYAAAAYEALSKGTHKEGHLVFKTTEL